MKRLFFIIMVLFFTVSSLNAQDSKGWYLEGSLQGSYEKTEYLEAWDAAIGVGIHKVLGKKFSRGIDFSYLSLGTTKIHGIISVRHSISLISGE